MSDGFWHVRSDFLTTPPAQIIQQFWEDDELNRQRSLATFSDLLALVDEGLTLYMEPMQAAYRERNQWKDDVKLRASIAMQVHAINSFLAKRHLLTHGYLAEAQMFTRSIQESLYQALVFAIDETFAKKFYTSQTIPPKKIRNKLLKAMADAETPEKEIYRHALHYNHLSRWVHPTLDSFSIRTLAQESGNAGLAKAVPENVVMGGFLDNLSGSTALLELARNIVDGLTSLRLVIKEDAGE